MAPVPAQDGAARPEARRVCYDDIMRAARMLRHDADDDDGYARYAA